MHRQTVALFAFRVHAFSCECILGISHTFAGHCIVCLLRASLVAASFGLEPQASGKQEGQGPTP
eukprot:1656545-Pyramimonas_sp.AAC.1